MSELENSFLRGKPLRLGGSKSKLIPRDISESLGKLPPQDRSLEEGILGGALLIREAQIVVLEKLMPDDFYTEQHKEIFQAIVDLATNGQGIDLRTVKTRLEKTGKLELVGGAYYLMELTNKVANTVNIEQWCLRILELSMCRQIIQFASQLHHDVYEPEADPFLVMDQITAFPLQLVERIKSGAEQSIKGLLIDLVKDINTRDSETKPINGIPSGYERLDRITLGWQDTNFIIVAARPGMGKTTLALNFLRNAAIDHKVPVAAFSLEMSARELSLKLTAMETEMDNRTLTTKLFNSLEMDHFTHTTVALSKAEIYIDDTPGLSIMNLRIKARRMVEKFKVKFIVVDYLQLMKGEPHTLKNREQEVSSISRGLKLIAKELKIPVLALSQLGREVEKRPTKIPLLSDLRESGSLEQDADIVMFAWRPGAYKIDGDDGGTYAEGLTKLIIAKHRGGPPGEAFVSMIGKTSKFKELSSAYLQYHAEDVKPGGTMKVLPADPKQLQQPKDNEDDLPF